MNQQLVEDLVKWQHCWRWAVINLRRGILFLVWLSERALCLLCVCLLPSKSLMTELPCCILLLPLNRILCGKANSPWGQLEGWFEQLHITKAAFRAQLQFYTIPALKRGGLCGLQMCSTACHKMTNRVCRRLYCQTSVNLPQSVVNSALLTETFAESVYKKREHLDCVVHFRLVVHPVELLVGKCHIFSGSGLMPRLSDVAASSAAP